MASSFGPNTFTPTGVRIPVESMSVRALIGIVQAFDTPGRRTFSSSSASSFSGVMPGRHSDSGLRLMTVSIISSGAGSVAESARPALPNTDATSGTVMINLSWVVSTCCAVWTDAPGSVMGM